MFTEDDKAELIRATVSQTICPAGSSVDPAKLSPALRSKVLDALGMEFRR
jgi:hypothetical protein